MYAQPRHAPKYPFVATAQVEGGSDVRPARVKDLSILGTYLAMPDPFSKGESILVKIRTKTEFFQSHATVAHSTHGIGMGARFHEVSPPFLLVLQGWLANALT